MVRMGEARAGPGGARVRRHQRVAAGLQPHLLAAATHPQRLPDQANRRRVEGLLKDHVAVAMALDARPARPVVGGGGQGLELGPLGRLKALQRRRFRRPMEPRPRGGQTPLPHVLMGLGDQRRRPAAPEVAVDLVDAPRLDLALVRGRAQAAGGEQQAVMLRSRAVGALPRGIVEAGFHDPRVQVIEHHPVGHPTQAGERMAVERNPGGQGLLNDTRHVLLPALRQPPHKRPGLVQGPGHRIAHQPGIATVDLRVGPRRPFHPHRRPWVRGRQPFENTLDRGPRARIAVRAQPLPDGGAGHPGLLQRHHDVAVWCHGGDGWRRGRQFQGGRDQLLPLFHRRSGGLEQALGLSPRAVPGNGPTVQARRPLDHTHVGRRVERSSHLASIHTRRSPASHHAPPGTRVVSVGAGRRGRQLEGD